MRGGFELMPGGRLRILSRFPAGFPGFQAGGALVAPQVGSGSNVSAAALVAGRRLVWRLPRICLLNISRGRYACDLSGRCRFSKEIPWNQGMNTESPSLSNLLNNPTRRPGYAKTFVGQVQPRKICYGLNETRRQGNETKPSN